MPKALTIGQLAKQTGLTTKTIRYYEARGLLPEPERSAAGYRLYSEQDAERLVFIQRAKRLGFSLDDVADILTLHAQHQPTCIHVLALLDQKLAYLDGLIESLQEFRGELDQLRRHSRKRLQTLPDGTTICGIVEQGIHARGEQALTWLEAQDKTRKSSRKVRRTP
jgi:DNA-binding transcriptional MerR regulator